MSLASITVKNYRSVRSLTLPVEQLCVFVGANGVGKTNLYKALALLRHAADGTITHAIAEEGGIESVLWAGSRSDRGPVRLALAARFADLAPGGEDEATIRYEIEIGLPSPTEAAFAREPLVKEERLIVRQGMRDTIMMERMGPLVTIRNENGQRESHREAVLSSETALAAFRDGTRYPELEIVRREMLEWRFYHDFRTDAGSPIRQPCHAIVSPTLSPNGHNLAAVLATLSAIRQDTKALTAAIGDAFPGARLEAWDEGCVCRLSLAFPEVKRPFSALELSDGTLKYLCLLGALMGYRLPPLIALNEPEASLHPSLLQPLARLVAEAARHTQIWIVTHSDEFSRLLQEESGKPARRVIKSKGATCLEGLKPTGEYRQQE